MQVLRVKPSSLSFLKYLARLSIRLLLALFFLLIVYKLFQTAQHSWQNWAKRQFVAEFKNFRHVYWLDEPREKQPCPADTKLFILILSRRESWTNRKAIRQTWYNDRVNGTVLRFFLAENNPEKSHFGDYIWPGNETISEALNTYIEAEQDYFGDTVFLNGIADTYANLHIMMHAAFQWQQAFCPQAKYVLKTDDDTVVHLGRLDHWIQNKFDKELEEKNAATCFGCPVIHSKPIREKQHRWFVPEDVYPNETYPNYIQGCTYLCSGEAINRIMAHCPQVNAVNMEDVLYTGIVAEKANVSRSDQRWHFYWGGQYFTKQTYCDAGTPYITAVFGYIYSIPLFESLYANLTSLECVQDANAILNWF